MWEDDEQSWERMLLSAALLGDTSQLEVALALPDANVNAIIENNEDSCLEYRFEREAMGGAGNIYFGKQCLDAHSLMMEDEDLHQLCALRLRAKWPEGCTALDLAMIAGHEGMAWELLRVGGQSTSERADTGYTAAMMARTRRLTMARGVSLVKEGRAEARGEHRGVLGRLADLPEGVLGMVLSRAYRTRGDAH
eukprot:TRINITY_DN38698_c0_g1_i1.p1 TRINITY_DN38698_c0_g1~~TRINITY_DN38698_c0_g1_i1.p1  ORF type:complete len:194 (+),score=35.34 TRINITY_DN38698_c0_g1_i1:123-704(+)